MQDAGGGVSRERGGDTPIYWLERRNCTGASVAAGQGASFLAGAALRSSSIRALPCRLGQPKGTNTCENDRLYHPRSGTILSPCSSSFARICARRLPNLRRGNHAYIGAPQRCTRGGCWCGVLRLYGGLHDPWDAASQVENRSLVHTVLLYVLPYRTQPVQKIICGGAATATRAISSFVYNVGALTTCRL